MIVADPLACEGRDLVVTGHLTFTRHGSYISDEMNSETVLSAFLSQEAEHRQARKDLIAVVRAQPLRPTRTIFGRFTGRLIRISGEKPRLEVFSGIDLTRQPD